jgi:hypothetical protein
VLSALALSPAEKGAFRSRLDSKDLHSCAEQRTLRHLLIRWGAGDVGGGWVGAVQPICVR